MLNTSLQLFKNYPNPLKNALFNFLTKKYLSKEESMTFENILYNFYIFDILLFQYLWLSYHLFLFYQNH